MGIYVETFIHGPLEEVWWRTQDPGQHERWDLRFSGIKYLPRPDLSQPQQCVPSGGDCTYHNNKICCSNYCIYKTNTCR